MKNTTPAFATVRSQKEMFMILDSLGNTLMVNENFQSIMNFSFRETYKIPLTQLMKPQHILGFLSTVRKVQETKKEVKLSLVFLNRFEKEIKATLRIVPGKVNIYVFAQIKTKDELELNERYENCQKLLASRFNSMSNTPAYLL